MNMVHGQDETARRHEGIRGVTFVLLIVGLAISVHLFVVRSAYWWLPLAVVLVPAHAVVVSGAAWLVARVRHVRGQAGQTLEVSNRHGHLLHNPRSYDRQAKIITLGGEGRFRRRLVALAGIQPGADVLDVGCGTGSLLIEAAKRVGPSGSLHGVDRSAEMIAYARSKAAAWGVNLLLHEESSDRLPFPSGSFDAVFCTLMLHHLPVPMQWATLAEMRRVLRPNGRIIVVDLQRTAKTFGALSLIGFIHRFQPQATLPDWGKMVEFLRHLGVQSIRRRAIWGETVCALEGRIAPRD